MELAIIILSMLLLVASAAACIIFYLCLSQTRRERTRFDGLTETLFDYRIIWIDDLSEVKFSDSLASLIERCGEKADKSYVRRIFAGEDGENSDTLSMCVSALKKSGVTSEYSTNDGCAGLIKWRSVALELKGGRKKMYSLGSDISDEVVSRNITDRLRSELVDQFDYTNTAAVNAEAGVFALISDPDSVTISTSLYISGILGFEDCESIPVEKFYSLIKKDELMDVQRSFNHFLAGTSDTLHVEASIKIATGAYHTFTIECRINKNTSDYRKKRTGMIFDTTSSRINREAMMRDGQRDILTGLYNRSGFLSVGEELLEQCREDDMPAVLVCLQVVRLRKISMLFGIDMADTLMRLYAETLVRLADEAAVVGKMGAEDFAVLFVCSEKDAVDRLMKEVGIVVESFCNNEILPAMLKEQAGFISGACFYNGVDDVSTLYNKASVTLFSGSGYSGGVCSYFDSELEQKVSGRDIVENEIGDAIRQGEMELYYQPKISLKTGEIIGAEALMRWNHRTQGVIMPGQFIHIAEEMGIITKLDEWGMQQACIQNRMWQEKGYARLKISVNMSQAQLYQTDVVTSVRNALEASGISPDCLEVELTETMAMLDIDRTVSILNSLKKLGVSISMDDFGTGYSSLASLKILPIDLLKMDRSLVCDIESNKTARTIAKAIVEMSKAMDLTVLAEGVETEGQRDILDELGCDVVQGFLYSQPQPAALLERAFLIPELERRTAGSVK
ncbi:MAG: EAL domain-containing protein [Oscillospiraceae bacterium]|nr:EAL domain-containing protein [Oscillospiraceae bacterium]